jgi:hypothetical protein
MSSYQLTEFPFVDSTFMGFKIDKDTGRFTIDLTNNANPGEIDIPADDVVRDNQYRTWIWTKSTIQFEWSSTNKTHLLMEIL